MSKYSDPIKTCVSFITDDDDLDEIYLTTEYFRGKYDFDKLRVRQRLTIQSKYANTEIISCNKLFNPQILRQLADDLEKAEGEALNEILQIEKEEKENNSKTILDES